MSSVNTVLLVSVKDVRGKEHGEEEDDPGRLVDALPKTVELGLPSGFLHNNDLGPIFTDDLVGIDEEQCQNGADEHENNEGSIGTIGNSSGRVVEVLDKHNEGANNTTALKMIQNELIYRPWISPWGRTS